MQIAQFKPAIPIADVEGVSFAGLFFPTLGRAGHSQQNRRHACRTLEF
jgi:hypothetical protein